jgi:hypothetical protein
VDSTTHSRTVASLTAEASMAVRCRATATLSIFTRLPLVTTIPLPLDVVLAVMARSRMTIFESMADPTLMETALPEVEKFLMIEVRPLPPSSRRRRCRSVMGEVIL